MSIAVCTKGERRAVLGGPLESWQVVGVECGGGRDFAYHLLAMQSQCRYFDAVADSTAAEVTRRTILFAALLRRWARGY